MQLAKITRPQEEIQTLKRFIENQGDKFISELAVQDRSKINEPSDVSYKGIEYQITYGDQKFLEHRRKINSIRKGNSNVGESCVGIRSFAEIDYPKILLETALKNKKDKSDNKTSLLIDCICTPYVSLLEIKTICKKYFNDNEQKIGGLWQHIFIVFSCDNVQLR
ncbi:MAG: hypothetical protein PHS95_03150 [Candidatus Pacebacteria bacterium]|nr:hypothetical protein [Candidatus Paceibacterota bacterium]